MPRSDIAGYPSMSDYPKWMYHPTEAPKMVKNESDEETLLGQGWSSSYIQQEYPKYVDGKVVNNPDEDAPPAKTKK
jgi:hypothetical protein